MAFPPNACYKKWNWNVLDMEMKEKENLIITWKLVFSLTIYFP